MNLSSIFLRYCSSPEVQKCSCDYPQQATDFSQWERLTLSEGKELERIIRWLARKVSTSVIGKSALSANINGISLRGVSRAIEFYSKLEGGSDHSEFFRYPQGIPEHTISSPHHLSRGSVYDMNFMSVYEPLYEPFTKEHLSYKENRTVHARVWKHPPGESLATVIAVHGFSMGDQRVNAIALAPGFFFRMGLDVVLYELPYHGRRVPKDMPAGASLFPSLHVARTNEAIAQSICDLRSISELVKQESDKPLGVIGMSLGGYTAALWASLDKLAFAIPMVPLVSMAEVAWDLIVEHREQFSRRQRKLLNQVSLELLRKIYAYHCPLNYKPRMAVHRRMIIAGLGDSIIPAWQPHALWEHWDKPRIHWFSGDHFGQLSQSGAFKEVHKFLSSLELAYPKMLEINDIVLTV